MNPIVQDFFDENSNTFSYVVTDPISKCCAIIDSVLDYDAASATTSTTHADQIIEYIKNDLLSIYEHIFESSDFETTDDANNYFKDVLLGILEPSINLLFGQDIEKVYQAYIRACTIQERQQEQEIAAEEFKKFLDFLDEDHN